MLKPNTDASPSRISRDWKLNTSKNGLLSSIGGKFTSAKEDAACIVDALCRNLDINESCKTFGKPFPWLPIRDYQNWMEAALNEAVTLGIDNESAHWLLRRHGNRVSGVFELVKQEEQLAERITPLLPFIIADLVFCAHHEMVVHLEDLLRRRLPLLILSRMKPEELLRLVGITVKSLAWDDDRIKVERELCRKWTELGKSHES